MSTLTIQDLCIGLKQGSAVQPLVQGIRFEVKAGRTLGLVGESGSGKTMTALAVLGLLPKNIFVTGGSISFEGEEMTGLPEDELRRLRGAGISMIFQEPFTCLNPVITVGDQIVESLLIHRGMAKAAAWAEAVRWLARTGITEPEVRARQYPHQFSGGMRQRAMIALALACGSRFLIADEPTTALDVTIQAQILDLLDELKKELNLTLLVISHDIGVINYLADEVAVMSQGRIVEQGAKAQVLRSPEHEYTRQLMEAYHIWAGGR